MPNLTYMHGEPDTNSYEATRKRIEISNSLWSFLMSHPSYVIRDLCQSMVMVGQWNLGTWLNLNNTGDTFGNFFHLRKGGEPLISYLPAGKEHQVSDSGVWLRSGRQTMKPGRWLRELISLPMLVEYGVTEKELEGFANSVKAFVDDNLTFMEVKGRAIRTWYSERKHGPGMGTLSSSCMRYEWCQKFFRLYERNPNCSLLVGLKDGKVMGRALLWRGVTAKKLEFGRGSLNPVSINLMDRIYTVEDYYVDSFKEWATKNSFFHKHYQQWDEKWALVGPDGECHSWNLEIPTGIKGKLKHFPYMDTFTYISSDWKSMSNDERFVPKTYGMHAQDGVLLGWNDRDLVETYFDGPTVRNRVRVCEVCRRNGDFDCFFHPEGNNTSYCGSCVESLFVYLYPEQEWVRRDDPTLQTIKVYSWGGSLSTGYVRNTTPVVWSEIYGGWIVKGHAEYLEYMDDWVSSKDDRLRCSDYDEKLYLLRDLKYVANVGLVYKELVEEAKLSVAVEKINSNSSIDPPTRSLL